MQNLRVPKTWGLILLGINEMIGSRACLRTFVGAYRSGTALESNQFPQIISYIFKKELI